MKKIHLLLIEDSLSDITLIKSALDESDIVYSMSIANDGLEGINYFEFDSATKSNMLPDLILLDINMPKLNGLEVLEIIKKENYSKHIPVIVLTTSSSPEDILAAYKKYTNSYVVKPDSYDSFEMIVQSIKQFWFQTAKIPSNNK